MFSLQSSQRYAALALLLSLITQFALPAFSEDVEWQAKPLVDTSVKPQTTETTQPAAAKAAPTQSVAEQAALEAQLKPAEPFIASVEKQLSLKPKANTSLITRLTQLQDVLYGEQKYQDAGELLAQLASLFPTEAAKAHADLTAQMKQNAPTTSTTSAASTNAKAGKANGKSVAQPVVAAPQNAYGYNQYNQPQNQAAYGNYGYNQPPAQNNTKKKHFWNGNDNDPFANDPFFKDEPMSSQPQPQGPSKLAGIGQGLAGLAMMAGAVAGNYYLNKNSGNVPYSNNGYYNNPYYGYGNAYPYGYGAVAPGYRGYAPNGVYGNPYYANPYAYGGLPGMTVTTTPYQRYGTSTISPLGVPTGF